MTRYLASKKFGVLALGVLWAMAFSPDASAQTVITTLAQLRAMSGNGNYVLGADINASATQTPGQEFQPIGTQGTPFTGTFSGAVFQDKPKYKISNLKINSSGQATGLFGYASGAQISYIALDNVSVTGLHQTGGLVGVATNTVITKVGVTGAVTGAAGGPWVGVGMIVGWAYGWTELYNCWAVGTVSGPIEQGGGLVGGALGNSVGGINRVRLISTFSNVTLSSTVSSQFTSTIKLGGIIGVGQGVEIQDASSVGSVTAREPAYVGGIAGDLTRPNTGLPRWVLFRALTRSVVTATGSASPRAGTIGHHDGNNEGICASIWDTADTGAPRSDSTACQTGFSTAQLQAPTQVVGVFSRGGNISCPLQETEACGPMHSAYPGGSDGRWEDTIWNYNSATEHTTLKKIPNSVQPK